MYHYLIVDDEPMIRYGLRYILEHSDFPVAKITEAEDGKEAVAVLQSIMVDFVFIDINMPKMNGIELAEYICGHFSSSVMCIISGYDDFGYAQQAIRFGIRDYLLKPVNRKDFYHTLAEMIKEKRKLNTQWMKHEQFSVYVEAFFAAIRAQNQDDVTAQTILFLTDTNDVNGIARQTMMKDLLAVLTERVRQSIGENVNFCLPEEHPGGMDQETWFKKNLDKLFQEVQGVQRSPHYRLMENAFLYMEREGWNASLDEIAREVGVNASYFSRIFREETGKTFVAYRTDLRMKRAAELLDNLDKPVSVVALEVGYADMTHFIRVFKKYHAQSPSEYRKRGRS